MSETHEEGMLVVRDRSGTPAIGPEVNEFYDVAFVRGFNGPIARANAARLVAAWNACAGIPSTDLTPGCVAEWRRQRDELQAFKDWTHNYLDSHGVPHHPPGTHGAAGCRIGDRMDWLMAAMESLEMWVELELGSSLPQGSDCRDLAKSLRAALARTAGTKAPEKE